MAATSSIPGRPPDCNKSMSRKPAAIFSHPPLCRIRHAEHPKRGSNSPASHATISAQSTYSFHLASSPPSPVSPAPATSFCLRFTPGKTTPAQYPLQASSNEPLGEMPTQDPRADRRGGQIIGRGASTRLVRVYLRCSSGHQAKSTPGPYNAISIHTLLWHSTIARRLLRGFPHGTYHT
jgi:hypothetical protein